jgi:hypothetical protein
MDNLPEDREKHLDNQLSEHVDLILADKDDVKILPELLPAELAGLQKNILRLKAATRLARPNTASTRRVRTRLIKEWDKNRQSNNFFSKFVSNLFTGSSARQVWSAGLALLFIFVIAALQLFPNTNILVGTASGSQIWAPIFILTGIGLIVLILWLDRRN